MNYFAFLPTFASSTSCTTNVRDIYYKSLKIISTKSLMDNIRKKQPFNHLHSPISRSKRRSCLIALGLFLGVNAFAQQPVTLDTTVVIKEVTVTARSEIRKLKESAMPISVIGQRQLQGTASNINDALARTVGVTIRNTGGLGSASRISLRGL